MIEDIAPTEAVNPTARTLSHFANQHDAGPFVMLNLLKFAPDQGRERYAQYARVASQEIAQRGGRLLYVGDSVDDGINEHSAWDRLALVYYPSRAAFLDMQNSTAYQGVIALRTQALTQRLLYAFKQPTLLEKSKPLPERLSAAESDDVFVANLLCFSGLAGHRKYLEYRQVAQRLISDLNGDIAVFLEADFPLVSDELWENFVLVRYPSIDALQHMLASEEWQRAHRDHRAPGLAGTIVLTTKP